jgi:hypothetical protein
MMLYPFPLPAPSALRPDQSPGKPGGAPSRSACRRSGPSWLLALLLFTVPIATWAVVCPFTNYMPAGPHPVGHSTTWVDGKLSARPVLVQWWYPAAPIKDSTAANFVYSDYLGERMQTHAVEDSNSDPELRARMAAFVKKVKDRGVPWIRFDHLMAASMLATRESKVLPGDWPVLWLDGDPSFGDELASHGFVVVSSPPLFEQAQTQDARVDAARDAIEATRARFQSSLRHLGFIGFREHAPLAARLSGTYPQSAGLALIGDWPALPAKPSRKDQRWLDPDELHAPTLQMIAGATAPKKLTAHPLQSPFSVTTRLYFGDVDDAHLEFGLPESCVNKYTDGRQMNSLTLLLMQREVRLRLAMFFGDLFDVEIKPAPLKLLPIDERRREPLNLTEEQLPARLPAPPGPTRIGELIHQAGVEGLLNALPAESRAVLPASWWESAMAQVHLAGKSEQVPSLIDAWQLSQPGSLAAAVHHAALVEESGADASKLWKQARKLLKSERRLQPRRQAELAALVEAALKKR